MSDKTREEFETWACDKYAVKFFPFAWLAWKAQQKKIDALEAENPQVECPACRGEKKNNYGTQFI
jgi:hypothetical protein